MAPEIELECCCPFLIQITTHITGVCGKGGREDKEINKYQDNPLRPKTGGGFYISFFCLLVSFHDFTLFSGKK